MASVSDLNVRLGLITRDFDRNLAKVERDLRNSGRRLSSLGDDLTVAISAPLAAFGFASIKAAGDTESLTLALEDQIKSAEGARKEYELLRKEALKPGLGLEQALRGSVALQAVGYSAEKSRKTLSNFGNALALAGKGKAELDGVVLALTQISAKGKISAEEINQIAERLPQIRTLMKQASVPPTQKRCKNSASLPSSLLIK
jgi:tape measure domain-containing protein